MSPTSKSKQVFQLLKIKDITVDERFRKDLGDIDQLAKNLEKRGTFHPVVVSTSLRLLAGGRRLAAAKQLNWESIYAHIVDAPDAFTEREIELEENTQRKNLTWQEEAKLAAAIHELYTVKYGPASAGRPVGAKTGQIGLSTPDQKGWSIRDTSLMMGGAPDTTNVQTQLRVASALKMLPSLEGETSLANAMRKIRRLEEDLVRELLLRKRAVEVKQLETNIIQGDATSLILSLATDSIDCIITDPPYGDDNLPFGQPHRTEKEFDDSPEAAMALIRSIGPELRRVLKPSGHLYAFFSAKYYDATINLWRQAGFDVAKIICIWHKLGGDTGTVNWDFDYAPTWEPFLLAHDRTRRLAHKRENVFDYKPDSGPNRFHPNQKPVALIQELIAQSTDPGELILDPFGGSGSVAVAATQTHRRFITFELSERFVNIIKERVIKAAEAQAPVTDEQVKSELDDDQVQLQNGEEDEEADV